MFDFDKYEVVVIVASVRVLVNGEIKFEGTHKAANAYVEKHSCIADDVKYTVLEGD